MSLFPISESVTTHTYYYRSSAPVSPFLLPQSPPYSGPVYSLPSPGSVISQYRVFKLFRYICIRAKIRAENHSVKGYTESKKIIQGVQFHFDRGIMLLHEGFKTNDAVGDLLCPNEIGHPVFMFNRRNILGLPTSPWHQDLVCLHCLILIILLVIPSLSSSL